MWRRVPGCPGWRRTIVLVAMTAGLVSAPAPAGEPTGPDGPTTFGQRGLLRAWSAGAYDPGSVVVGSTVEFFKSTDFLAPGDDNQRMRARLVVAGVPLEGLEITGGLSLVVNRNTGHDPPDTQWVGDPFLGIRYGRSLGDRFSLGAGVQAVFPTGSDSFELALKGISVLFMTSFGLRPHPDALISLNLGYHLDNSSSVFAYDLDEVERFAAGVNPHDQVMVHLGAAWRLGPVAPFLEVGTAQAVGAGELGFADSPTWLTLGLRAFPLEHRTLHLLAAVDIGLSGMHPPAGKARIPPYNVVMGIAYDFGAAPAAGPAEIREVVKVERVEVPAPAGPGSGCRIEGQVVDADSGRSLPGARIVVDGESPVILLSDPEEGRFATCPNEPGPVKLTVHLEGYRAETQVVLAKNQPEPTRATIRLHSSTGTAFGVLRGTVRALGGQALPAAVAIPARTIHTRANQKNGKFELRLATGTFDVLISHPGFVTQRQKVKLGAGDVVILNVELYPKE